MQDEALLERVEWCRKYAQINAVALRKARQPAFMACGPALIILP